jgi:uncharacterized protein YecT (DUF1311 family)
MQIANLILIAGILVSPAANSAETLSARQIIERCAGASEAGIRDCLVKKSHEIEIALQQAAGTAIVKLSNWDEDPKYVAAVQERLKAAQLAFEQYRDAQCAYASALGGGAIGNALELRRLACVVELNSRQAQSIASSISRLPTK